MINCSYIIEQVKQNYLFLQSKANENLFFNQKKLFKNTNFEEITYKINAVIFDLEKAKFLKDENKISALENQLNILLTQKTEIEKNLNLQNLEPTFLCKKCNDTGYTAKGICHCYYNHITKKCYEFLGVKVPKLTKFENDTLSQNSEQKVYFDKLLSYATNFNLNSKSLLLLGQTGTGKTFLSQAIAQKVSKKNFNVIYLTACEYSQILLRYHLAPFSEKNVYYEILTTCDLLVIDDIGTEPIYKNVTLEYTHAIISHRITLNKPFIITTNLSLEKLLERYGERLFTRITAKNVAKIEFKGKNLR